MELEAVVELRKERDEIESKRQQVALHTKRVLENARRNIRALNGTQFAEGEELPKYEDTGWVILKRHGNDVICGSVEVQNYTKRPDDQRDPEQAIDGRAMVYFASARIDNHANDGDTAHITQNGEPIAPDSMSEIVDETTVDERVVNVLSYVPPLLSHRHEEYRDALTVASDYLDSMDTSMNVVFSAAAPRSAG